MAATAVLVVRCPHCGAKNRVDHDKAAKARPRCARCHELLVIPPRQERPLIVTDANAAELLDRSPLPVLLEFASPYCLYCQRFEPTLQKLARELSDRLRVAVTNIEENRATAARYGVRATPTLAILDRGKEVDRAEGLLSEEQLRYRFARHLR
jgi:thioredoxin 2